MRGLPPAAPAFNALRGWFLRSGPMAGMPGGLTAFVRSGPGVDEPDIQLVIPLMSPEADVWWPCTFAGAAFR
ncbi:hypothetical protein DPM13_00665 [Paracoccus mutanolyticus]|uniref:Uncharacterized protein n=1 Tax=Paracoccus mutanolyticus TaxID=1499308 RepID=A0ABM6WP01_9RHOB|nr:hypothetical protein [Paracoccus mutanolyticus]AWX92303.1 hypothetical protein DPM13_00665 [Paracoccus mutanolyticus]